MFIVRFTADYGSDGNHYSNGRALGSIKKLEEAGLPAKYEDDCRDLPKAGHIRVYRKKESCAVSSRDSRPDTRIHSPHVGGFDCVDVSTFCLCRGKDAFLSLNQNNTSLRKTPRDAVAGINDIMRPLTVKRLDELSVAGRLTPQA